MKVGGVTPLSVKKKSTKNWPKNSVFWAKKTEKQSKDALVKLDDDDDNS